MKKLIIWLVSIYNKSASVENKIEVVKPITFKTSITAAIRAADFKGKEDFLESILSEKKYDLGRELLKGITDAGLIREVTDIREKEINIYLELKIFDYEKRQED